MGALIGAIGVIVLLLLWPWLAIWAVNTLFGLTIGYTLETWGAALVLMLVLRVSSADKK